MTDWPRDTRKGLGNACDLSSLADPQARLTLRQSLPARNGAARTLLTKGTQKIKQ